MAPALCRCTLVAPASIRHYSSTSRSLPLPSSLPHPPSPNPSIGYNDALTRPHIRASSSRTPALAQHRTPLAPPRPPHLPPPAARSLRRSFSSSAPSYATVSSAEHTPDLTFPTSSDPSPFDIFHFKRDDVLTPKLVKSRFYALARLYHPDRVAARANEEAGGGGVRGTAVKEKKAKGKGKGKEVDYEFKQINKAYELLSDPGKREMYLRTGIGWGKTSGFGGAGGGGGGWPPSPYSQSTTEYHFRRGRPYSGPRTGAYAYDWRSDPATWADPFNPHFRPHEAPRPGGMASNGAKAGWEGQGLFGRNGVIFLVLLGVTTLVTPLTAWGVGVEFGPAEDDGEGGGGGAWMPRVGDRSHADAAQNLMRARQEAREMGAEKMDAIRRRVEEIRRAQAFEQQAEAMHRQQAQMQHLPLPSPPPPLALPPPSSSPPP